MRLAACLGIALDIIEPCGFVFDDKRLQRAGMDYTRGLDMRRHRSWAEFEAWRRAQPAPPRLVALTTRAAKSYVDFAFARDDIVLVGRESAGLPPEIHATADARLIIPMTPGMRSLNVATAAAMVLGEAQRQVTWQIGAG